MNEPTNKEGSIRRAKKKEKRFLEGRKKTNKTKG